MRQEVPQTSESRAVQACITLLIENCSLWPTGVSFKGILLAITILMSYVCSAYARRVRRVVRCMIAELASRLATQPFKTV